MVGDRRGGNKHQNKYDDVSKIKNADSEHNGSYPNPPVSLPADLKFSHKTIHNHMLAITDVRK